MKTLKFLLLNLWIVCAAQLGLLSLKTNQVIAAEKITLKYGIFSEVITTNQLEEFVLTGNLETPLGDFLKQNTSLNLVLQRSLKQEIPVNITVLDKYLNSIIGDFFLDRIGQVIQMPAGDAHRKAIRSAIILSSQDNHLSMLEVIKNYPDEQVVVDGENLEKLKDDVSNFIKFTQSLFTEKK
jgi:hypothetical protein